jgi:hypothetical protein
LAKYDTTYLTVLKAAKDQGVAKFYPIECYVQRQQLKFIWKILHLDDLALQRIVLHGKLDPQYSQGRGGRQRTYKHCISEAMDNFGVTMVQCMNMSQQDWNEIVEGSGLEKALQQWKVRPKASKPIDMEWRNHASRKRSRPPQPTVGSSGEVEENASENSESADTESEEKKVNSHIFIKEHRRKEMTTS